MNVVFKYTGTALPTDSDTFELFNSVTAFNGAGHMLDMRGIKRILISLRNDESGTLKMYESENDDDTGWVQCRADEAVSAVASNDDNEVDFLVEGRRHVKIEWENGGTTQTSFAPNITGICDRSLAT